MALPVLLVIVGSTRPGRIGPGIARWFAEIALAHGGFEVEWVDLLEVGLPLLDEPENPARGGRLHHAHSRAWSATVARGDAFVFVTPEYNHGYNAATKNAIDYLFFEWADKAVGMVSYGGNVGAGTRAVQALTQVFHSVKAVPVKESVNIPFVYSQLGPGGSFAPGEVLDDAARQMLDEMARRERALSILRTTALPGPALVGAGPSDITDGTTTA